MILEFGGFQSVTKSLDSSPLDVQSCGKILPLVDCCGVESFMSL